MDAAPVLLQTRPLFRNIHHRQIQHFQQTVVCRENALGFCNLPQLPVKALDRVRGIDQTAVFLRIFEVNKTLWMSLIGENGNYYAYDPVNSTIIELSFFQ